MASESFIVHIYRRDNEHPERLVGQVEDVNLGYKHSFHSMEKLWCILTGKKPRPAQAKDTK